MNQETPVTQGVSIYKSPEEKLTTNSMFVPLNGGMSVHARELVKTANGRVYQTILPKGTLRALFLDNLPEEHRQRYKCRCCLNFLESYGGLVVINDVTFETTSVLFSADETPSIFTKSIEAMRNAVQAAPIDTVFYLDPGVKALGVQTEGTFNHFYMYDLPIQVGKHENKSADTQMRIKMEDMKMLRAVILKYKVATLQACAELFQNTAALRSRPTFAKRIEMLWDIRQTWDAVKNPNRRENMLWALTATMPEGIIHFNGSPADYILDAMVNDPAGLNAVIQDFLKRTNAENYMQSTAAPTEGLMDDAKRIVADLGVESAFYRRAARLDEFPKAWEPKKAATPEMAGNEKSIFDGIKTKPAANAEPVHHFGTLDGGTMSLRSFEEDILPRADKITVSILKSKLYEFTSAAGPVHADAGRIFAYDLPDARQQLSFFSKGDAGSYPGHWGLEGSHEMEVEAIIDVSGELSKMLQGRVGRLYVIKGMTVPEETTSALFPELMRLELHPVRKFVSAFSLANKMANTEAGFVGIYMGLQSHPDIQIKVTSGNSVTAYRIDRAR